MKVLSNELHIKGETNCCLFTVSDASFMSSERLYEDLDRTSRKNVRCDALSIFFTGGTTEHRLYNGPSPV